MYRATTEIAAAPEQVFALLTDPERMKSWQPDAIESHPPEGGVRVGARAHVVAQEYGRRFSVEFLVVALTPNERLAWDMDTSHVSARIEYRLVRHGNRTGVECTMDPKFKGVMRFLAPFLKGMLQRKMESRVALLRDVVEAGR